MKVCVYEHPQEKDFIIFRFERFPLYEECKKLSFFIDIDENDFDDYIKSVIETYEPEDYFESFGRMFLLFTKESSIRLLNTFTKNTTFLSTGWK